jgi:glycogen phosphorylase
VAVLRRVDPNRLAQLSRDEAFLAEYATVMEELGRAIDPQQGWFEERFPELNGACFAYFCAEFGLHNSIPIYSGGLGILAGDHCKSASDLSVPLIGVGLLYSKGYFDQKLNIDGWQEDSDELFDPRIMPLVRLTGPDDTRTLTVLETAGRPVHLGAWKLNVGRVQLYLLDTNLPENDPSDRELTYKLYGGGQEHRLKQEWILGVGGVRVLRALGISPGVWHANEGHAAFMLVERVREQLAEGKSFDEAVATVRARSVFTTHTPVPAGHDIFYRDLIDSVCGNYYDNGLLEPRHVPRARPSSRDGPRLVPHDGGRVPARAPSQRRGEAAQGRHAGALGVPLAGPRRGGRPRHVDHERRARGELDVPPSHDRAGRALRAVLGEEPAGRRGVGQDPRAGRRADLGDARHLKVTLLDFCREQARRRWKTLWKDATHLVGAGTLLSPIPLTIGFARRFATYKRASLLFRDERRLQRLLTDPHRPVQLIFAGKAHPADDEGKRILQRVWRATREPEFEGRIAFVEDYDVHVAHRMVQGVDLWMNLPRVPMEACGTSGMKAALNFVPQLSTLDGWWAEGFNGENGWAIPTSEAEGDELDAADHEALFTLLEREVVPAFYERDDRGIPTEWLRRMKQAMIVAAKTFTSGRMVKEYTERFYVPALSGATEGDDPPTDDLVSAPEGVAVSGEA